MLPIPNVQGRVHSQMPSSEGSAEKASMMVVGTKEWRMHPTVARVDEVVEEQTTMLAIWLC